MKAVFYIMILLHFLKINIKEILNDTNVLVKNKINEIIGIVIADASNNSRMNKRNENTCESNQAEKIQLLED